MKYIRELTKLRWKRNWMLDYLENDRDILTIWDGDDNLYGTNKAIDLLPFLNLRS